MIAWALIISLGTSFMTVGGIASEGDCLSLAKTLKADFSQRSPTTKCVPYRTIAPHW